MGKVMVEVDLDDVLDGLSAEEVLDAFNDDEEILRELVERLGTDDILNELDEDEIAANLDYDCLSALALRDVAERIADKLTPDEAIDFCRNLLRQACDNDVAAAEEKLIELAKSVVE